MVQDTSAVTYSDCITCHNRTAPSTTGKLNITSMNLSSTASHKNLTEGITNSTPISDDVVKACWACHWNGTDPNTTHPNKTTFNSTFLNKTAWLCYDCHSNTTGGITDVTSGVTSNYSAPAVYAHIPQNAMNSITGTSDRTNITTSVQCWFCHNRSVLISNNSLDATNLTNYSISNVSHYGTNQSLINTTICTDCHKNATNASFWYFQPNASSASEPGGRDLSDYINLTIRHPAAYANNIPNYTVCKYCHNSSSVDSFHSQDLVMPAYVHRDYDWEGDGDAPFGTPIQAPQEGESCIACHQKMFGVSSSDPRKTCEDCHVVNLSSGRPNGPFTTGPFFFSLRSDYNQSVPLVYEHWNGSISGLFVPDVKTRNMSSGWGSTTTLSTCMAWNTNNGNGTCHGVSWENRSGSKYFAFNRSLSDSDPASEKNMIPYKYGQGPIDFLPPSTNCTFCHIDVGLVSDDPSRRERWGYAPTINSSDSSSRMFGATNLSDCYFCHVENTQVPNFFHDQELTVRWCDDCHFNFTLMNDSFSEPEKWVNETMFNSSVHGNASIIFCQNCHTMTEGHSPPESRWRWCEDCHVVIPQYSNGSPKKDVMQRHNMTFRPQFNLINVSGVMTSVVNITDCTICHNATMYNQARSIFNRTSGKNCRFCHSFPDLNPDSPY
jgi:hypothetical protein